jgi:hypothetical protein
VIRAAAALASLCLLAAGPALAQRAPAPLPAPPADELPVWDPGFPRLPMPEPPADLTPPYDPWKLRAAEAREAELAEARRVAAERREAELAEARRLAAERAVARRAAMTMPAGATIDGIAVGGLSLYEAYRAVKRQFARPVVVDLAGERLSVAPGRIGAVGYVESAVKRAKAGGAGAQVPLTVRVRGADLTTWVRWLARRVQRAPVDARLRFVNAVPRIVAGRAGRALDVLGAREALVAALLHGGREVTLPVRAVPPAVGPDDFGSVVVIQRASKRLNLYEGAKLVRTFGVATGQSSYPTPLGRFEVVNMARDPWWTPPASDWAEGLEPVPPGPGNPLGTRWMGISSPGVGIHGTPDAASIGYSASHGCIRMRISDAEWLFEQVAVGTPVYIAEV